MKTSKMKKADLEKIREIAIYAEYRLYRADSSMEEVLPGVDIGGLSLYANLILISEHKGGGQIDGMDARRVEKILGLNIDISDMSSEDRQTTIEHGRRYQIEGAGFSWF